MPFFYVASASFLLGIIFVLAIRRTALHIGFIDRPTHRKFHIEPTPLGGGVAIFLATSLTVLLALLAVTWGASFLPGSRGFVDIHFGGIASRLSQLSIIFAGATLMAAVGLFDDIRGIKAGWKLLFQIVAALLLVGSGIRITLFIGNPFTNGLLTVIWVVGITNAFNLLDNMDGVSAGVGLIVIGIFSVVAFETGQVFVASLLLALGGTTLAFLLFNFPPAKIFMGDCGSLFLGYMIAALTVVFTFYQEPHPVSTIFIPLVILALPIYDTASVIVIRLAEKRSPFEADKRHFSHRLVDLGMSVRQAVLIIYLMTFALGLLAVLLYRVGIVGAVLILIHTLAIILLIVILERAASAS
jgi:UDP-GlcNAc:undecaprenyl-phosphate GlcNAc-1-phosphate transferase